LKKTLESFVNKNKIVVLGLLAIILILATGIGIFAFMQQKTIIYNKDLIETLTVPEAKKISGDYFGVLVLGSDQGATKTNGGNHTDSITYVAMNRKTKKAYALPIYRDAFIYNKCTNTSVNINHIYRDSGAECLTTSVSDFLGVPVDYYIYITSNGFVDLFNTIGPLTITAEASYCSKYGNDENEYCFTDGQTQELNGNQLLAYARYRGNTSGERRAMRHIQILNKAYEKCVGNKLICLSAVSQALDSDNIQTDLPYESVIDLGHITQLEMLSTIAGSNFQDDTGWHQGVNENDLHEKVDKIKNEIFI